MNQQALTDVRSAPDPAPGGSAPSGSNRPSRSVRLAWLVPGGVLAVAALLWGTYNVLALLAHGEYTTTSTYAAEEITGLDIANDNGSVVVIAHDGDDVIVTADIDDGWRPTEAGEQIVDGTLQLRGRCPWLGNPWCSVDYTVRLPHDVPVTIDASDGSVTVRGVVATIDADTDNGSVFLEDVGGDVRGTTNNGRVVGRRLTAAAVDASTDNGRVELSFLDPPDAVTARTDNGRIEISVPDLEVAYRVEMTTGNGSTDSSVRTDPSSDHVIDASTGNGAITVRPPD